MLNVVTKLCDKIDAMNAELNIPKTLKEFGIKEDEFKEKVNKIAELAVGDACTGSNPRPVDTEVWPKFLMLSTTEKKLISNIKFV